MVGNSSAGIVELPSFKKPNICLGSRQKNRLRAENTVDINVNKKEILEAVRYATTDSTFKNNLVTLHNPYGTGDTSSKIVRVFSDLQRKNYENRQKQR
jgi:UDP-N-acetylglucosamine 2-epimerase